MIRMNGVWLEFNQDIYIVAYSILDRFDKRSGKPYKKMLGVYKDKLSMLGEKHFTVKSAKFGEIFKYDDYGITWFDSYKDAKKFVLRRNPECKLSKITNNTWELVTKND